MLNEIALFAILSFTWLTPKTMAAAAPFHDPNYAPSRDVMVHLFEWRWEDIAKECERFLAPMGYGGVQVSPPNENAIIMNAGPNTKAARPWFERYQPVSYALVTRSGNENQFRDMVRRCNAVGVRIYVDVVFNHMTSLQLPNGTVGTNGTAFDSEAQIYQGVPYGPNDFNGANCSASSGSIENYTDAVQVRNCRLNGLNDLNQAQETVRQKITEYLNKLLSMGVAGFRIDAAKHMWPEDLDVIFKRLNPLSTDFAPDSQPLIYQEVNDMGGDAAVKSQEYVHLGRVTEFKYGMNVGNVFRKNGNQTLKTLQDFGEKWGFLNSDDAVVFIDNHYNQRGQGGPNTTGVILTFREPQTYKKAICFMLAWPYGLKQIMSSYAWDPDIQNGSDVNNWMGPPHNDAYDILPVRINQTDESCSNGWVCEHRWPEVAQMVRFAILSQGRPIANWFDNGANLIAFSRGSNAFLAINNDDAVQKQYFTTGLPAGYYCDILTGIFIDSKCTGRIFTVDLLGSLFVALPSVQNSMLAIHTQAMVKKFDVPKSNETDMQRTVILIYIDPQQAAKGRPFIRGGINLKLKPECNNNVTACDIPVEYTENVTNDSAYNAWKGNKLITWNNPRHSIQFNGISSAGVPLMLTSNNKKDSNYYQFNTFGQDYWGLDVQMDCSQGYGWFEIKVYQSGSVGMEKNIFQGLECCKKNSQRQCLRYQKPASSLNHVGMCGKLNVFKYGSGDCSMKELPVA